MVSVYLLNLIIYISLNPIKLAVYHIKIALSWLSPVRLNYCWRESCSSVLPNFPPKKVQLCLGCAARRRRAPAWCGVCWWWDRAGPAEGDSSTPTSCLHPVTEVSLKSAGLLWISLLAAGGWSSPLNVVLWQKAAVSQGCWWMAAALGVLSCFILTYWDYRGTWFLPGYFEVQNLKLIRCDQKEGTKVSSLQLFQWQPTGCRNREQEWGTALILVLRNRSYKMRYFMWPSYNIPDCTKNTEYFCN